ncbi:mini-chromosome maintenance complex-binding protein isoform X1 [Microcaecilia unicolor]|uniref:Mini-chromosome maintenance complex-binding protein n=1 Tax=Microcaecilia unicolor TaxID=1415580 RepID=A0A6P7Y6V2_9AMPH|nr:mini-chromosome maintenance complex-binding protein isoform X1 [Microcaecilia unicolor]
MPCSRDWLLNPLGVVQELFAHNGPNLEWEKKVTEYFREKLKENNASKWVPSLNEVPLHYLKPNSLVRFRCMVQDMFDPELYMGVYETVDASSKSRVLHFGKYRDMAECGPRQEVDVNSAQTVTLERQTFYCVPVPGESPWVKEAYASSNQTHVCPSTSYAPSRHKRSYDDMECQPSRHKESCSGNSDGDFHGCGEPKRLETEAPAGQWLMSPNCSPSLDLNFPLPGEKGPACLVKVYENRDNLKVNDVLEVFGVLSVDSVPCATEERENTSPFLDAMDCADSIEEQRVHSPPASLVPRIHVLLIHKLQQINPLIPSSLQEEEKKLFVSGFMLELSSVRAELLGFLTHAFLGDSLAAEYLILHLISTVYARRDVLPLGKFSLNLSGCPRSSHFPHHLYRILQQLVPSSYNLQMTIQNMNTLRFVPRKDYTSNRLLSGLLQLASNTLLQIDETVLEEGQLDTTGVQNVTALGNLITWQKVDYDFRYHQMEFPCNINVLVTSEGRSLLPSDCQVHLKPEILPPNMEEYVSNLLTAVVPSLLNKFRIYLSLVRLLDYSISDEVTKAVEEDFVEMRKNDPQSITADDLHRILVVARLLSLSAGQTTLSRERWLRAKQLESQRKTRLQQQQCVNGNEL